VNNGHRKPRVSVGMPLYNREKYVGAAIEAHLNQTFEDFELIITDNASTDASGEICRAYAARDSRVKYYLNERNLGATGNYRRCFELSGGEYFRWTPSDDMVSDNLLERAIAILDRDASVLVAYGRTKLIDAEGNIISDFDERLHLMDDQPSRRWKGVQTNLRLGNLHYGLTRRAEFSKTGLLRSYSGGDFPLIAELSLYGKFYEISDAFFYRRIHEEAASSALKDNKQLMAFYNPGKADKFFARTWVHLGANWWSVTRAPIGIAEKMRIYSYMARQVYWAQRELKSELGGLIQHAIFKAAHSE
jgi:glycosyltransferase involved in cell wall biosynthesis